MMNKWTPELNGSTTSVPLHLFQIVFNEILFHLDDKLHMMQDVGIVEALLNKHPSLFARMFTYH